MNDIYDMIFASGRMHEFMECRSGYADAVDCSWYHGNWMLLRRLGLVSNPLWHERFYRDSLAVYADSTSTRLLVLGTADFSMALLCERCGVEQIAITDMCKTPLNICEFVSRELGFHWSTIQCDIRSGLQEGYDVIVSDAFLTRFDYSEKEIVMRRISQALNPGGVYITTARKGWNGGLPCVPSRDSMDMFVRRAGALAAANGFEEREAMRAAQSYITRMVSFPVKDEESLKTIANDNLSLLRCKLAKVPGECEPTEYYQVVFQRRS